MLKTTTKEISTGLESFKKREKKEREREKLREKLRE